MDIKLCLMFSCCHKPYILMASGAGSLSAFSSRVVRVSCRQCVVHLGMLSLMNVPEVTRWCEMAATGSMKRLHNSVKEHITSLRCSFLGWEKENAFSG